MFYGLRAARDRQQLAAIISPPAGGNSHRCIGRGERGWVGVQTHPVQLDYFDSAAMQLHTIDGVWFNYSSDAVAAAVGIIQLIISAGRSRWKINYEASSHALVHIGQTNDRH